MIVPHKVDDIATKKQVCHNVGAHSSTFAKCIKQLTIQHVRDVNRRTNDKASDTNTQSSRHMLIYMVKCFEQDMEDEHKFLSALA